MTEYKFDYIFSDKDLNKWYDFHKFKGFDKDEVAKTFLAKVPKDMHAEILVVCATVSPVKAIDKVLTNGKTLRSYGFGMRPKDVLTVPRIQLVFPQVISDLIKKLNIPKRVPDHNCPAEYQFFGAAKLQMDANLRNTHIDFCKKFSDRIGGVFKPELYELSKNN